VSHKTVRQLELTYGGGKTHTLITLLHLVSHPDALPDLPAVDEFVQHIGMRPPKTLVVSLPFDKIDVEKGMEVKGPDAAVGDSPRRDRCRRSGSTPGADRGLGTLGRVPSMGHGR
jgi:hypothetical protein